MMALRMLLPLGLWAGVASGCTSTADGPIDYQVTGGFAGSGDGTTLHVDPDGTATRHTELGGTRTSRLEPQVTADLYRKVANAQFPTLAPVYDCNCADDFIFVVTVQLGGDNHTVSAHEFAQVPERLSTLLTSLKEIAELE